MVRSTPFSNFKKDVEKGNIYLRLVERYEETGERIPERFKGIRKVSRVTGSSVILLCTDGTESHLTYTTTKLFGYDGKYFSVYTPGKRCLTDTERHILENAYAVCGNSDWLRYKFIENSSCPWMVGNTTVKGKKFSNGMIFDNNIRGRLHTEVRSY